MNDYSPKYVQIYDKLRTDIVLRRYLPGSFLPTDRQLMEIFKAGRGTVRRVLSQLQTDGFITIQHGSGSSVLKFDDKIEKFDQEKWHAFNITMEFFRDASVINTTPATLDIVGANKDIAVILNLQPGDNVYRVQRIRMLGETPYLYRIQYLRQDIVPDLEKYINEMESAPAFFEKIYNINITGNEEHITAKSADFVESRILGVEVGAALLHTRRITTCEKGNFEYAEFIANPEYQGYKINVRYG
jgi:GntR family transcriptional regulator